MAPTSAPPAPAPRVPIGVFLGADCQSSDRRPSRVGHLPSWHGATPVAVAEIIRTYTTDGDLIIDLDTHPTVTAAAWFLHRIPATLTTGRAGQRIRVLAPPPGEPAPPRDTGPPRYRGRARARHAAAPRRTQPTRPSWPARCSTGAPCCAPADSSSSPPPAPSPPSAAKPAAGGHRRRPGRWAALAPAVADRDPAARLRTPRRGAHRAGRRRPDRRPARPAHRMPLVFTTAEFPEVTHV